MSVPIKITVGDVVLRGEFRGDELAREVLASMPLDATRRTFGDAYYIETPITAVLGPDASDEVDVGDVAYWPAALAVVVFFGPTPESAPGSERPVAASDVSILGHVEGADRLADAREAKTMRIEVDADA